MSQSEKENQGQELNDEAQLQRNLQQIMEQVHNMSKSKSQIVQNGQCFDFSSAEVSALY